MQRGTYKRNLHECTCVVCSSIFITKSHKAKYCDTCRGGVDWHKNSLNLKYRLSRLYAGARYRANVKGLPFNVDKDYLHSLWEQQDGKCAITNRPLDLAAYGNKRQVNPNAPSLDRIHPEKGYVRGNVRFVTYHINVALSEFGDEALRQLAHEIVGGIA